MRRPTPSRAVLGGVAGTAAMTAIGFAVTAFGLPRIDCAQMVGAFISGTPASPGTPAWWLGLALHGANGALLISRFYAAVLYPLLPGEPWRKGLLWGLILWGGSSLIALPAFGAGVLALQTPQPALMLLSSLISHAIYGVALGAVAGSRVVRSRRHAQRPRALVVMPEREPVFSHSPWSPGAGT